MPSRLRLAQRLTRPDGVPTTLARAGVAVLMVIAAAIGWAVGPEHADSPRAQAVTGIDRLRGELPMSGGDKHPELASAARLPAIRGTAGGPPPVPAPAPTATSSPTPTPTASPEPTPTPEVTVVPVASPPAPAPTAAPPRPTATPAPTFDSSG